MDYVRNFMLIGKVRNLTFSENLIKKGKGERKNELQDDNKGKMKLI